MSLHPDPTIAAFLADGGYASVNEWMRDSDYTSTEDGWMDEDGYLVGEPEGVIEGAIESSGFSLDSHPIFR